MKSSLPENFNINDIGRINLKEAEEVANENILFLTEDDLIEGLEDFDLIPLKDEAGEDGKFQKIHDDYLDKSFHETRRMGDKKADSIKAKDETVLDDGKGIKENTVTDEHPDSIEDFHSIVNNILSEIIPEGIGTTVTGTVTDSIGPGEESIAHEGDEIKGTGTIPSASDDDKKTYERKGPSEPFILSDSRVSDHKVDIGTVSIPDALMNLEKKRGNTLFIDDISDESQTLTKKIFEENVLEKSATDIIEISSKNVKLLTEAGMDMAIVGYRFLSMVKETTQEQHDFMLDFIDADYKYRDTELDFVDDSIFDEDYSRFIREIDEFYDDDKGKIVSSAVEIFGIDNEEGFIISDRLFSDEYKHIDLDKEIDLFKSDQGIIDFALTKERYFNYLVTKDESLSEYERLSIEEDISSKGAVIFEEDIEDIKKLYGKDISRSTKDKKVIIEQITSDKVFEDEFGIAIDIHEEDEIREIDEIGSRVYDEVPDGEGLISAGVAVEDMPGNMDDKDRYMRDGVEAIEDTTEAILNITDKIVILEDELDIDRFIKEFPEKKGTDLKGLLKYLDGLFEKLPESTIRSFANSEYFDLYVKILKDLGI